MVEISEDDASTSCFGEAVAYCFADAACGLRVGQSVFVTILRVEGSGLVFYRGEMYASDQGYAAQRREVRH